MKIGAFTNKQVVQAILSGTYTPYDLREFVQLCHDLALPMIRKKIALGKLRLDAVGLKEPDVVYDCIADLFRRDAEGKFPQIQTYFEKNITDVHTATEEELLTALRRLIFGKINNSLVRLYSEIDPTLGKILRNIKLAIEKSKMFEEVTRFSDVYLVPVSCDALQQLAPMPSEYLEQEFSRLVLVHDTIPVMLKKLHTVLVEQESYQRMVSLVTAGMLCKQIYKLGWETEQEVKVVEEEVDGEYLAKVVDQICQSLHKEMHHSYVEKGKCTGDMFRAYLGATKSILNSFYVDEHLDGSTFYEYLEEQIHGLTKEEYRDKHRPILEYFIKIGKERLKHELRN